VNLGQGQNQYAKEGSSRQVFVRLDNDGQLIDLNQPYEGIHMNEPIDDEELGEFQNAEGSNQSFDLNF